jgi:hypothetical protein
VNATKTRKLLTVPQATTQVRRHVDRIMPGVLATVESKLSHDLDTDTPTVVTTVTFPKGSAGRHLLYAALTLLSGYRSRVGADSSIVITRAR